MTNYKNRLGVKRRNNLGDYNLFGSFRGQRGGSCSFHSCGWGESVNNIEWFLLLIFDITVCDFEQ